MQFLMFTHPFSERQEVSLVTLQCPFRETRLHIRLVRGLTVRELLSVRLVRLFSLPSTTDTRVSTMTPCSCLLVRMVLPAPSAPATRAPAIGLVVMVLEIVPMVWVPMRGLFLLFYAWPSSLMTSVTALCSGVVLELFVFTGTSLLFLIFLGSSRVDTWKLSSMRLCMLMLLSEAFVTPRLSSPVKSQKILRLGLLQLSVRDRNAQVE